MKEYFKIESKELFYETNTLFEDSYEVKSVPFSYKVQFMKSILDIENYFVSKYKQNNFVLWDKEVQLLYNASIQFISNNSIAIQALELNKNIESVLTVVEKLSEINFTKQEIFISIGGGIIQDISAFTRSIYKRGVNWVYFPTTLLSMADSCIGGKAALNYKTFKNQVGLFSSPKEVVIYSNFLNSLSENDIYSGYGEIIKLAIIGGDHAINEFLHINNSEISKMEKYEKSMKLSLKIKKAVIEKDEFETDIRRALNYGHTIGHAIEPIVNYQIPHGIAVSIGMIIENNIAAEFGYLSTELKDKYNKLIGAYIPKMFWVFLKDINCSEIYNNILQDKKTLYTTLNFTVPINKNEFEILRIEKNELNPSAIKTIFEKSIVSLT